MEKARLINYYNSDFVFIGSITGKVSSNNYTVRVVEQFKGILDSIVQLQINQCSFNPEINGLFIFYAKKQIDYTHLIIEECSISRNIEAPEDIHIYEIPPPPFDFEKDKGVFDVKMKNVQLQAKLDLNTEIDWLRKEKSMYLLQEIKIELKHLYTLFISVSALVIILIIVFFLKNRRIRKSP